MKILLVSPSTPSSGNTSTAKRIQGHFRAKGHVCLLCDPKEIATDDRICSRKQLNQFLLGKNIQGVIFLHAYKSGKLVTCGAKENTDCCNKFTMRYGVIFGGTDLNVDVLDISKREVIKKVAMEAHFCVAFTEDLKDKALQLSRHLNVLVQPQAVHFPDENGNTHFPPPRGGTQIDIIPSSNVFLMVTGIRDVKDPVFILEEFTKWSCEKSGCRLVIIGPVLDEVYGNSFFKKLEDLAHPHSTSEWSKPKVKGLKEIDAWVSNPSVFPILYAPPLPSVDLHALLHRTYILACVNSSVSEGMSSAILEAMSNRVLVIARDNPGNRSLISEGLTGLLFDSTDKFVKQAERVFHDPELRNLLVSEAYAMIIKKHSVEQEGIFYNDVCTKYFGSQ